MALIRLGPMVSEARGSIGGTVFSKNRAGHYTRARTKPVYPGSDSQNERAAMMATVVETWQTLTVAQRNAWMDKVPNNPLTNRIGDAIPPSAFNLYVRSNLSLLISGQTVVVPPPTTLVIDAPWLTLGWTDGTGIQVTNVHGWAPAYTDVVCVQRLAKQRLSQNFHKGPYDLLYNIAGATFRTVPHVISTDAYLQSDTRTFFRFKVVTDDGAVSMAWHTHVDVGTIT